LAGCREAAACRAVQADIGSSMRGTRHERQLAGRSGKVVYLVIVFTRIGVGAHGSEWCMASAWYRCRPPGGGQPGRRRKRVRYGAIGRRGLLPVAGDQWHCSWFQNRQNAMRPGAWARMSFLVPRRSIVRLASNKCRNLSRREEESRFEKVHCAGRDDTAG